MKKFSPKTNLILNSFRTLLSIIFPLITYPYVTRILQPEGIGKVEFAYGIATYFTVFAGLGVTVYGLREVSKLRNKKDELSKRVHELFFLNLITSLIVLTAYLVFLTIWKDNPNKDIFLLFSLMIVFTNIGLDWVYQGFEDYFYITVRTLIFQLLNVALLFLCVKTKDDAIYYALFLIVSSVGSNVINLIGIRRYINIKRYEGYQIFIHVKKVFVIFVTLMTGTLFLKLESILLGTILGYKEVGIFTVANKLITTIMAIVSAIGMTYLPTIIHEINNGNPDKARKIIEKAIGFVFFISLPIMTGLMVISKRMIILISGDGFLEATIPLMILSPIILLSAISVIYGNQVFLSCHQEKRSLQVLLITGVLGLLTNLVMIPLFSVKGAALTILCLSLLGCYIQIKLSMRYLPIKILSKNILKPVFSSVIMGVLVFILNRFIPEKIVFTFLIAGFGAAVYFLTLLLVKDIYMRELYDTFFEYLRRITTKILPVKRASR
jgi:O-antigen/teichoic acid export membrane protein